MTQQVFSGTTLECLKHYAATLPKGDRALGMAKKPLIKFTGAKSATVGGWLNNRRPPVGEYLVKVRYFLGAQGYRVRELEDLNPMIREFGKLVAYGVIGVERAVKELSLPSRDYLLDIILRGSVRPERSAWADRMTELASRHRTHADDRPVVAASLKTARVTTPPVELHKKGDQLSDRALVLQALANSILSTIPLAERVVSNSFSAEERRILRSLTGDNGVFRLKNLLSRLCGETARKLLNPLETAKPEATRREK